MALLALEKLLQRGGAALLLAGAASLVPSTCLYTVDAGQRAIVFSRVSGIDREPKGEGLHFALPWFQTVYLYDVRRRVRAISTATSTRDMQTVQMSLRLLFRPCVDKLADIHTQLGGDYDDRVLPSISNEVLKAAVAQFDAEQLLTERARVSAAVRESLSKRSAAFNIVLDDVAITDLQYGKDFAAAIELKQVAEQEAEREQYVVARAEQEMRVNVIRAEGEAEAAAMISGAFDEFGTGLIDVRRIDATLDIVRALAGNSNISYVPRGKVLINTGM